MARAIIAGNCKAMTLSKAAWLGANPVTSRIWKNPDGNEIYLREKVQQAMSERESMHAAV